MKRANALARSAQSGVKSSVESLASAASTFVRTKLPTVRARLDVESAGVKRKPAAKTVKRDVGHAHDASRARSHAPANSVASVTVASRILEARDAFRDRRRARREVG